MATAPKLPQSPRQGPTPISGTTAAEVVAGPVPGTRVTEAYARLVARDAYFWAWPMVNIYNRRQAFAKAPRFGSYGEVPCSDRRTI